MKRKLISIVSLIALVCLALTGCEGLTYTSGSGDIQTKVYDLKDFNTIDISNAFKFKIERSDLYSVSVSCRDNIVPYLDVFVSGQNLTIGLKPGFHTNGDLNTVITLPEISRLNVSGASSGSARGFKSANNLVLTVSGSSQLDTDIEAGKTTLEISGISKLTGSLKIQQTDLTLSGVSRCELTGTAGDSNLEVSGASQLSLQDFQLQNVDINVSGASTATIKTDSNLNLDVSGASTLEYYGNPTLSKVSVTGASKIKSKS